jgi:hypothetical protein
MLKTNRSIIMIGAALLALNFAVFTVPARAQQLTLPFSELDTSIKTPKETYLELSRAYTRELKGEALLQHKFRLPKTWADQMGEARKTEFSSKVETLISHYIGPPNMYARSSFKVKVLKMEREMDLMHWYFTYMGTKGYSVTALKEWADGRRVEAEGIRIDVEATFVMRSVAMLSGDLVVIAEYSVPDPFWSEQRDEAVWSASTFNLKYTNDRTIEPRKEFSILDIVKFNYPGSWQVKRPKLTVVDELSAVATSKNQRGEFDGRLDAFFLASHAGGTREDNLKLYKEKYKNIVSFGFGDHMETIEALSYSDTISAGRVDIFKALRLGTTSETGYEIWMALLESDVYDGYVFMSTVGREIDFVTWAKNQRSFKIMVGSMELHGHAR